MTAPTEKDRGAFWRPSANYTCGQLPCGKPCQQGPDATGHCQTSTECIPVKRGARWHCTRAASAGGPCTEGPNPHGGCQHNLPRCTPIRSPRRRYRIAIAGLFLIALGAMLLAFGLSPDNGLSPGPLSAKHAAASTGCNNCHLVDPHSSMASIVGAALSTDQSAEPLCVNCHADKQSPHLAHDGAYLTAISAHGSDPAKTMACRDCHQEHDNPLLPTVNGQQQVCNSCHETTQQTFPAHSDFADYPYQRTPQLRFDHREHLDKHFPAKSRDNSVAACSSCHSATSDGRYMAISNFQSMCSDCHNKAMAAADPVVLLAMPTLDRAALANQGLNLSSWPEEGDDTVFPNSALLTIENLSAGKVRATLLSNVDVSDLSQASAEQLALVAAVTRLTQDWRMASNSPFSALLQQAANGQIVSDDMAVRSNILNHADPVLRQALAPRASLDAKVFPKPCGSCHAPVASNGQSPGWQSALRSVKANSTVAFSHRQHLIAIGDRGCQSCHTFADAGDGTAAPSTAFAAMDKNACASCHRGDSETGTCTSCHDYHLPMTTVKKLSQSTDAIRQGQEGAQL